MTLNGVMALTVRYFTEIGKPAFQHITTSSSIELIDQKSASITHRVVKFVCVTKFTHSRVEWISALFTFHFNLSFKFRFTVALFDVMLGFRFTVNTVIGLCLWRHLCASLLCFVVRYDVVVIKFTFAISSSDELLVFYKH